MKTLLDSFERDRKRRAKRRITDIEVEEISLVDRAATGKSFLITKADLDDEADEFEKADGEALRSKLQGFVSDIGPNPFSLPKAIEMLELYRQEFPSDVLKAIQSLAAAVLEAIAAPDAAPAGKGKKKTEKMPGLVYPVDGGPPRINKGEFEWPSLGIMTLPLLNLVNPEVGRAMLQKRAEAEAEAGPDERDAEIARLESENDRLRKSRSPSSQPRGAEFYSMTKADDDDDVEDRWPSLNLFSRRI